MNKYACISLLVTFIILGNSLCAAAWEKSPDVIQTQRYATPNGTASFGQGSASITIKPNGFQTLIGKSFHVYQLFHAENAAGQESINYTLNDKFAPALKAVVGSRLRKDAANVTEYEIIDNIQTLNTQQVEGAQANQQLEGSYSDYRYFVEDVRDKIIELGLEGDVVTVSQTKSDGSFTLGGLDFGYYVIDEVTANEDTHQACSLIMVNTANPTAAVNIKSDYPDIIKKILEDDNHIGWNDMADYEIGQTVPYKFESNIPNMNGYDTYFYAFEDKMDPCLTFDSDSVQVIISDGNKEYTAKRSEYTIETNLAGLTFKVSFADMKAIVDREFNQMNNVGENVYEQSVRLEYNATLNNQAALETGRPGFENTVRLQFSNDPDRDGDEKTGYTPWDTVVCFTFKANISKVNNHGKSLANAKFRLYSDKACQNEIFVKATTGGYIVINRDSAGKTKPANAVEMVSDAKGLFTIFGLDSGTYYLKETDSPAGYREFEDPIEITVSADYVTDRNNYLAGDGAADKALVNLTATAHIKEFLNLAWKEQNQTLVTDKDEGSVNLTVVNTVGTKLPKTGSSAFFGFAGISIALISIAAKQSRKSDQNE